MNAPLHPGASLGQALADHQPASEPRPAREHQPAGEHQPASELQPALMHRPSGVHLLADFHGVAPELLTDPARIDALLRECALAAGARILHSHFHSFGEAMGVTGVLLLAESHISIHTWPETGFAAADIFMCGDAAPQLALALMKATLSPERHQVRSVARGSFL